MNLFPRSIAVIGASADPQKVGHAVLQNLLMEGFAGAVYPVNPKGGVILGKNVAKTVSAISGDIDLAVIATPAPTVSAIVEECGKKGIRMVVVISAGFSETGTPEGKAAERKLRELAEQYHIDLIGPNCLGIIRPHAKMNASFAKGLPQAGSIALLSQSGAILVGMLDAALPLHIGFSLVVSLGNKTSVDECNVLETAADDADTKVIGLYLESVKCPKKFRELAARIAFKKPIVLLKSGTSQQGQRAVSSHTGALAGSDAAINALCAQTGVRRAKTFQEFLDLLRTLSTQPPLLSPRMAIITNAGGPGILAADAAEREHLVLPSLETHNAKELFRALPDAASTGNPIDVLGDADAVRYRAALAACGKDSNIDGVVAVLTPQMMTPCSEIAAAIVETSRRYPLMPVVTSFIGDALVHEAVEQLAAANIPNFETPEAAVHALAALHPLPNTINIRQSTCNDSQMASGLLAHCSGPLAQDTIATLLSSVGIPLPAQGIAKTAEEATALATRIGYPVVAKVLAPEILHKTDVGGIQTNLQTIDDVRRAFTEIHEHVRRHRPHVAIRGVLIQKFLPAGSEFIVGGLRDPHFGPLILVGLGGIYTELFRDTATRLAPLIEKDAYAMLQELTSWDILLGARGKQQADIPALAKLIVRIGDLLCHEPAIAELDLNPVLISSTGVEIVDAKIIVRP